MQTRRDVRELAGALRGETVFILGNGPSVREHDLSRLSDHRTIGMNASPLLDREHGFTSDYYVVSDARFLLNPAKREWAIRLPSEKTIRVLRDKLKPFDDPRLANLTYYVRSLGKNGFSADLSRGYYFGCTSSMLAIQLAAYLGCKRIVLLGNDLTYPKGQPRFYREDQPQDHDPFLSIQIWNIHNAMIELRAHDVEMVICTKSSNLVPYIRYVPFDDVAA